MHEETNMSDGFINWLENARENQRRERRETARRIWESMQPPERELSDFDKAIHERGEMRNYHVQKEAGKAHAEGLLFSESEINRRRAENKNNRHPMDEAMKKRLQERGHGK